MSWHLYILRCADNSLYTGITLDVNRRLEEHTKKKGSKALRGKAPLEVVYREKYSDKSQALKREAFIKSLTHRAKETLILQSNSR
jgi:putative endonuclease